MAISYVSSRRLRLFAIGVGGLFLVLLVVALLLLSFGWTMLRRPLEQRLSASLGRPVTIAKLHRTDHGFFDATLAIEGVRVGQPDWIGGGDFATVRRATVVLPILPILAGKAQPRSVEVDGLRVHLIRRDGEHANWKGLPGGGKGSGGPGLQHLVIRDGQLRFDDHKRDHFFTASLAADDRTLTLRGRGTLIGRPTTIALTGAGPLGKGKWPFRLDYRSPIANVRLDGVADKPLDLGHFDAKAHAWGDDLQHLDLLVEAGLPGTAPVRSLDAVLRHDRPDWTIRSLTTTIGRSRFASNMTVRKVDGRTKLDGRVVAAALDFDDLANAKGRARAAAKRAAAPGRRLPDTAIDLSRLAKTDARVDLDIRRLLFRSPSAFRAIKGTLTLDHGVLAADPFVVALASGRMAGRMAVTQTDFGPRLALDLRIAGSRIEALASDTSAFSGALAAHFKLEGPGRTIRAALGRADGRIAVVGSNGTISRQVALILGQDVGRGVFAKQGEVARLRCGIGAFVVQNGKARPAPLLIDTSVAQAKATGVIDLTNERIDLSLPGAPKQASALRLSGPIRVTGPLFRPAVAAPTATSTKGILRSLGRVFEGGRQPLAADADCAGLARKALR